MPRRNLRIEIRDQRLRGGRLDLSARTASKPVKRRREAAIRALLDQGEDEIIERLRSRELHISEVQNAVEAGDIETLRKQASEPLTMRAVLDRQMKTVHATTRKATRQNYTTLERKLVGFFGGDTDIRDVTKERAEAFIRHPWKTNRGKPWSAGRQMVMAAMAGAIWQREIDREMELAEIHGAKPRLTRNPWKAAETPKDYPSRNEWLKPAEWRDLWGKVERQKDAALYAVGTLAGLRLSEVLHLRPGLDVDLEKRLIRVQSREGAHPWKPKNPKRGERDVPMCDELHDALTYHAEHYAGTRYFFRLPGKDRPISQATIQKWTRAAFESAGLRYGRDRDGLTFHSTRHTFASWLVQSDVQLMKVAQLMGDTTEMVVKTYGHLMPSDLERAVQVVDTMARGENG